MYKFQKYGWCVVVAAVVAMSGCNSIMYGKQYVVPQPGEPSATVRMKYDRNARLDIMTFNDKGCYAGYTTLLGDGDFVASPVTVDKELILTYQRVVAGMECKVPFSFTPEKGATYTVVNGSWSEPRKGVLSVISPDQHFCGVNVVKKVGDQESVARVQQLRIETGFCLSQMGEIEIKWCCQLGRDPSLGSCGKTCYLSSASMESGEQGSPHAHFWSHLDTLNPTPHLRLCYNR
jgi:hypothetical protein